MRVPSNFLFTRIQRQVKLRPMKIVIAGVGSVGYHLAENLSQHNHDIVLIDNNPEVADYASGRLDCLVITDEANNPEAMKRAGVENADFFLAVTNSDEVNMIACLLVGALYKTPVRIARVRNVAYAETKVMRRLMTGIDFLANPEVEAARAIADSAVHGATGDVKSFERTDFQLRSLLVDSDSFFKDKSIGSVRKRLHEDFLIAGIFRDQGVIIPLGDTVIQEGDRLQLVSTRDCLERIFIKIGAIKRKLNNILMVGGGRLSRYVVELLIPTGRTIKIIENDYAVCQLLAERYGKDLMVIHGNVSDETVFEEEQLQNNNIIISTTGNQELNILSGIYAKTRGVDRVIAVVENANYLPMAVSLGVDVPVCPKMSSVDAILKFIRRGNIKTIHSIFDGQAEVIEYTIGESSPVKNRSLKDIQMPPDSLIVAVSRNHKDIIPDGRFVLRGKDTLLAFTKKGSVEKLEETFSG